MMAWETHRMQKKEKEKRKEVTLSDFFLKKVDEKAGVKGASN